jgi:hypothetical protein
VPDAVNLDPVRSVRRTLVTDERQLDSDDEEIDELPAPPPGVQPCSECSILIGPGYIETAPFSHPSRPGVVCWRCFESLDRRAARRLQAERNGVLPVPENLWDPRQRR